MKSMKYNKCVMLLGAVMALGACSKDDGEMKIIIVEQDKDSKVKVESVESAPTWLNDYYLQYKENRVETVSWEVTEQEYDTRNSMVIFSSPEDVESVTQTNHSSTTEDIIAAFVGDECRGVATCDIDDDGVPHYNLLVQRKETDPDGFKFVLKCHTQELKLVLLSEPIEYVNNGNLGTYDEPYQVKWTMPTEQGFYFFKTKFSLATGTAADPEDFMIIVDQDGFTQAYVTPDKEEGEYAMEAGRIAEFVVVSKSANPILTFKYYRAKEQKVYSVSGFCVESNGDLGMIDFKIEW